jgi:hypothetical protein
MISSAGQRERLEYQEWGHFRERHNGHKIVGMKWKKLCLMIFPTREYLSEQQHFINKFTK